MSCAAPGGNARDDLRRGLLRKRRVPDCLSVRLPSKCLFWSGMRFNFHLYGHRSIYRWSFTLLYRGFGIERGYLGEVVSLEGDCRPPPPGNPRQAVGNRIFRIPRNWHWISASNIGGVCFTSNRSEKEGNRPPYSLYSSLYKFLLCYNLKKLNYPLNFKINRSYFSCTAKKHVLEFDRLLSHICGLLEVKPPPIAITNVLV